MIKQFNAMPGVIPALSQLRTNVTQHVLERLPFYIYPVTACVRNELHWHDYIQIWYTVSGQYYHTVNGERRLQTEGSVALIYPYTLHAVDTSESDPVATRIISISVAKDVYDKNLLPFIPLTYSFASFDNFMLTPFIELCGKNKERADELCETALSEYAKMQAMNKSRIFSCLTALLEMCADAVNKKLIKQEIRSVYERTTHINNSVFFITGNASQKISLSSASNSAMMSERSFTEKFKQTVGRTYHSYLTSVRMANAVDFLRHTNKSISEISDECGFSNRGHFINTCAETFNMTPLALRRYFREWSYLYGDSAYEKSLSVAWLFGWSDEQLERIRRTQLGQF